MLLIGNGPDLSPELTWLSVDTQAPEASTVIEHCLGRLGCGYPMLNAVHVPNNAMEGECFAVGLRAIGDGISARREGVVSIRCSSASEVQYPMVDFAGSIENLAVSFAADASDQPLLVVGSEALSTAWLYAPGSSEPAPLAPVEGSAPASFGASVAVIRLGQDTFSSRLIAIGAPDAGQVWLYRSEFPYPGQPKRVGCLGTRKEFGRVLVAGDVDGDGIEELLVADSEYVTAFSGGALAVLSEQLGEECSLAGLPESAVVASVSCASGGKTSGCSRSSFGAAIAVADLDGDADGEIIVGAPGMALVGVGQTGAVLIFDAEGEQSHQLSEQRFDLELPLGAGFGQAIQVIRGRDIDYLAVGAPGAGAVGLLTCFDLTPQSLRPDGCF